MAQKPGYTDSFLSVPEYWGRGCDSTAVPPFTDVALTDEPHLPTQAPTSPQYFKLETVSYIKNV